MNSKPATRRRFFSGAAVVGQLWLLAALLAASPDQMLVLKDGTGQRVRSYEIQGDRVRYYSLEREDWEELPVSLVDWEATEKARQEAAKPSQVELEEAPARFQVAPGMPLPDNEGVYVFDGKNLRRLDQSQATVENDNKRRLLGAIIPVIKGRAWMELKGATAKVTAAALQPVIYVQLSQLSAAGYGIVRLQPKGDARILGEIEISPITGQLSEKQELLPAIAESVKAASAEGGPGIVRLSLLQPLDAGEYAVVELVEQGKTNLFVWDFSLKQPQQEEAEH